MQTCASSIYVNRLRVARLDASGQTPAGAGSMYTTDALVLLGWEPVVEEGEEFTRKNGSGDLCINKKAPDIVKRYNLTLDLCNPDPELTEILIGGTLLTSGGSTIGYAVPSLGAVANPNGVSIEAWSTRMTAGGTQVLGYWWWALPRTYWRIGPRSLENGPLVNEFIGYAEENSNWGNGPNNDWPAASTKAIQYVETTTLPTSACGAQATPAQV